MKRITQYLLIAGVVLGFAATELWAQAPAGSGNNGRANGRASFDPAQFQAQRLERYRQQLEVTGDAEWKVIGSRIEKVLTAQRDARVIGVARNRPGGGNPPAATDTSTAGNGRGNRGTRGNRGGASPSAEASPDVTDLQTARAAGVPCILMTYGYTPTPVAELGADWVLDDFADLPAAIRNLKF